MRSASAQGMPFRELTLQNNRPDRYFIALRCRKSASRQLDQDRTTRGHSEGFAIGNTFHCSHIHDVEGDHHRSEQLAGVHHQPVSAALTSTSSSHTTKYPWGRYPGDIARPCTIRIATMVSCVAIVRDGNKGGENSISICKVVRGTSYSLYTHVYLTLPLSFAFPVYTAANGSDFESTSAVLRPCSRSS